MRIAVALLRRLLLACAAAALLLHPAVPAQAAWPDHVGHDGEHGQHAQHRAPAHRHTSCCDLCVVHCGGPVAPGTPAGVPGTIVLTFVPSAPPGNAAPVASLRHRLPPALAPPSLLA